MIKKNLLYAPQYYPNVYKDITHIPPCDNKNGKHNTIWGSYNSELHAAHSIVNTFEWFGKNLQLEKKI